MKSFDRVTHKRKSKTNIVDPHGAQSSRRQFLKGAAVGLGIVVVPSLLAKPGAAQTPSPLINGYPDRASVAAGTTLTLRVSTTAPQFRVDFYRQGATLAFVQSSAWLPGQFQPVGNAAQDWNWPAYSFPIPANWPSGAYIAMLVTGDGAGNVTVMPDITTADGRDSKALFVVRSASPGQSASILYKLSLNTYQAYNHAGGGSLYRDMVTSSTPSGYKVTLRRIGGGTGAEIGDDAVDVYDQTSPRQTFAHWDPAFIGWLERNGYAVDYCTDLDLHEDPALLSPYKMLLSVGHDEYWSDAMRANVQTFVQSGGNVAFWSANTCWWRIQYADNNTSIICDKPNNDLWWSGSAGLPENSLIGVSYRNGGGWWQGDRDVVGYTVQHADHWVYSNTGLANGQTFGASGSLIGYECDGAAFTRDSQGNAVPKGNDGTPLSFLILGVATLSANWMDKQPRENTGAYAATMGLYVNNGIVFNCATVDWARVLGSGDPVVDQITRNVMSRLSSAGAATVPSAPTGLVATPGNAQVPLFWTGSAGATSYKVKRATVSGGPYTTVGTASGVGYTDSTAVNGTKYFYIVTAVNSVGESAPSAQASATPVVPGAGTPVYQINSGGGAAAPFAADQYGIGGTGASNTNTISTSGVTNPAPIAVYQSERYGSFTYAFPGLTPGTPYTVRLHFAENYYSSSGQRLFNVSINRASALSSFDIYATAGAANQAVVKEFTTVADSSGKITIVFTDVLNGAKASGIEILARGTGSSPTIPSAPTSLIATPGSAQVVLSWTGSSEAASYNVKRGTVSGGPYTTVGTASSPSYTDSTAVNGTTYFYVVTAVNTAGESPASSQASATPKASISGTPVYQVNSGGSAATPFKADQYVSGGTPDSTTSAISTGGVTGPAPQAVYQTERYGSFTYAFPGLTAGASYRVRLHFAESYYTGSGQRLFNVSLNSAQVLSSFDIYAAAGAMNKAVIKEFTATADSSGKITVVYTDLLNGAKSSGIEIVTSSSATIPAAPSSLVATPGNAQVALSWAGSAGAASYNVKRGTVSGGPYTTVGTASSPSYTDSTAVNGTTYFYVVTAVNSAGESPNSVQASVKPSVPVTGTPVYQVNSGGSAATPFKADQYVSGGTPDSTTSAISTGGVTGPAPQAVYQTERYGSFTYAFPGLTAGTSYRVRLHFAENYYTGSGQRLFNVSLNGVQSLSSFDIYTAAGAMNQAVVKEFTATADSSGKITIVYTDVSNGAKSSGIEIITSGSLTVPAAPTSLAATPGSGQVGLSWTSSSGAASYNVKRGTVSGGPYTTVGTASSPSYTDNTAVNGTTYYYVVTAVNSAGESAASAQVSAKPAVPVTGTPVYQVNSGGSAASPFKADQYFTGGTPDSTTSAVSTSGVTNPAPAAVYQTERWGDMSYVFPGLTVGKAYKVRLHFAEIYWTGSGQRLFNVSLNGVQVLSNFDIYAAAGAMNQAIVKEFTATADSSGKITLAYVGVVDDAKSSGIEIIS